MFLVSYRGGRPSCVPAGRPHARLIGSVGVYRGGLASGFVRPGTEDRAPHCLPGTFSAPIAVRPRFVKWSGMSCPGIR